NNSVATKETKKYKNADKDKKYNYEKALKKAKEVLANKKATQEEVNKALANLEKAKAQLNGKEVANSPSKRAKKLPKAGSTAETFTLSIAGLLSAAGAFLGLKKKDEDR
uniref:LPXTG cell wall anchor domain-containing protein n=1 Tax=uncultured Finegoldia sp. TaxID=328009 RepID=UPI0026340609